MKQWSTNKITVSRQIQSEKFCPSSVQLSCDLIRNIRCMFNIISKVCAVSFTAVRASY